MRPLDIGTELLSLLEFQVIWIEIMMAKMTLLFRK